MKLVPSLVPRPYRRWPGNEATQYPVQRSTTLKEATSLQESDYWRLLEITGDYWRLLEITGDYWRLLEITDYWYFTTAA